MLSSISHNTGHLFRLHSNLSCFSFSGVFVFGFFRPSRWCPQPPETSRALRSLKRRERSFNLVPSARDSHLNSASLDLQAQHDSDNEKRFQNVHASEDTTRMKPVKPLGSGAGGWTIYSLTEQTEEETTSTVSSSAFRHAYWPNNIFC